MGDGGHRPSSTHGFPHQSTPRLPGRLRNREIYKPGEAAGTEGKDLAFLASTPKKKNFAKLKHKLLSGLSKLVKKSQKAAEPSLGDDPDNIESLLAGIKEDLQEIMSEFGDLTDLLLHYSIRLLDSGGQPQFHEVVSISYLRSLPLSLSLTV